MHRYLTINCGQPDFQNQNASDIYGYMTSQFDDKYDSSNPEYIETYLAVIGQMIPSIQTILEVRNSCLTEQIFLNDFINDCKNHLDIQSTIIPIINILYWDQTLHAYSETETNTTIGALSERVKMSFNAELMFWYQYSVESAIMTHLFTEIMEAIQSDSKLEQETYDIIQYVHNQMISDESNIPTRILKGFELLVRGIRSRNFGKYIIKRFEEYKQLLNEIRFVSNDLSYQMNVQERVLCFI